MCLAADEVLRLVQLGVPMAAIHSALGSATGNKGGGAAAARCAGSAAGGGDGDNGGSNGLHLRRLFDVAGLASASATTTAFAAAVIWS